MSTDDFTFDFDEAIRNGIVNGHNLIKVSMVDGRLNVDQIKIRDHLLENMPRDVVTLRQGFTPLDPITFKPQEFIPHINFIETQDPPCCTKKLRQIAELHRKKMLNAS